MSENQYFSHKGGRGEGATQNCEHLKSMTADELTEKLAEVWDGMDETDYDPTLIDAYLDALEETAPIATDFDAEAALSDFKTKHARLFEEAAQNAPHRTQQRRPHRRIRFVRVAVIALLVTLGCMVTAQAFGYDVFGAIARWTEETFHFGAATSSTETPRKSESLPVTDGEYASLQEALDACGITEPLAPKWIPEEYEANAVIVKPQVGSVRIRASYQAEDKTLSVVVWLYDNSESMGNAVFEKDAAEVILYESGGITHYIMSNNARITAAWTVSENTMCSISGELTQEEMEQIINSIYER